MAHVFDPQTGFQGASQNYEKILVNKMYKAKLKVESAVSGNFTVETALPPQFAVNLNANWQRPHQSQSILGQGSNAAAIDNLLAQNGMSTLSKSNSSAVWTGGSEISIAIPFQFVAELDPKKEVVEKVVQLMQLVAPSTLAGGVYYPPGPHTVGPALLNPTEVYGDRIWLKIGTFLEFYPVFVDSVETTFDTQFYAGGDGGASGLPLYAICNVTVRTFWDVEKKDIATMFAGLAGGAT